MADELGALSAISAELPELLKSLSASTDGRRGRSTFWAALGQPTRGGSLAEAYSNANLGQIQADTEDAKLKAQYIPLITDHIYKQQEMQMKLAQAQQDAAMDRWFMQQAGFGGMPGQGMPTQGMPSGAPGVPQGMPSQGMPQGVAPQGMPQAAPRSGVLRGVDPMAAFFDRRYNKGQNLGQWMHKATAPDMVIENGVAIDKNKLANGQFLPGVSTSADGQTTMRVPDGKGGFRIEVPDGALDAVSAYARAKQGIANDNELVSIVVPGPNGTTQEVKVTKAQALAMAQGQPAGQQPQGNTGQWTPSEKERAFMLADAKSNGIANPAIAPNALPSGSQGTERMSGEQLRNFQQLTGGMPTQMPAQMPGLPMAAPPARTEGQKAVDTDYAKELAPWLNGGYSVTNQHLEKLDNVIKNLSEDKSLTGPGKGYIPDGVRSFTNPKAVETQNMAAAAVQASLKEILGAQYTENEGKAVLARAYNPDLSVEANTKNMMRLAKQLREAAEQKTLAAEHFRNTGSLVGFEGRLPRAGTFSLPEQPKQQQSGKVGEEKAPVPVRTGTVNGRKVIQFSDGSVKYGE